jgi:hypothetical protein
LLSFERCLEDVEAIEMKPGAKRKLLRDNTLRVFKINV